MTSDQVFNVYQRTDAALNKLESRQVASLNRMLTQSYKDLEARVRAAINRANESGTLTNRERELLVLEQLKDSLSVLNPQQAAALEQQFNQLLQDAGVESLKVSERVASLTNIDIEAAAQVATDGTSRVTAIAQESDGVVRVGRALQDFQLQARQVIGEGVARGDSIANITRAMRSRLDVAKSRAEMIVRTEVLAASNRVAEDTFERLGVEYLMFVATEDSGTCPYCLERAGNIYTLREFPTPPIHPNCRCFQAPADPDDPKTIAWADKHFREAKARSTVSPQTGASPFERLNGTSAPTPVRRSTDE